MFTTIVVIVGALLVALVGCALIEPPELWSGVHTLRDDD